MEFKTKPDRDRSHIKVFSDEFKYRKSLTDKDMSDTLSELSKSVMRHVDDISSIEEELVHLYFLEEDGNEYETLYEALIGELGTGIYGYYRCEYTGNDTKQRSAYADDFKELCELAYRHPNGFKLCETGTDKLTIEQQDLINKIVEFSFK